jgi:hypothetical protein
VKHENEPKVERIKQPRKNRGARERVAVRRMEGGVVGGGGTEEGKSKKNN